VGAAQGQVEGNTSYDFEMDAKSQKISFADLSNFFFVSHTKILDKRTRIIWACNPQLQSTPPYTHIPFAMATLHIAKALPTLPGDWSGENGFIFQGSLSAPVHRSIEPVGPHFLAHARRVSFFFWCLVL